MRRRVESWLLSCVVAVLLGSCATAQKPAVDAAAIQTAITGVNQKIVAAIAARDTDAVVSYYADDAHVLSAHEPRADGRDAIRAMWASMLSIPGVNLTFASSDLMVAEAGDLAVDLGTYQMSMTGPGGQPIQDVGKYVTVFKKVGDDWKIVVDTFNSDRPIAGK